MGNKNGVFAGEYGNHLQADPDPFITEFTTEEGNLARLTYACAYIIMSMEGRSVEKVEKQKDNPESFEMTVK